jgi:hypothetical protein
MNMTTDAKADIDSLKTAANAGDKMQTWLGDRGIMLDAGSSFEASQLQALMLFWHALPERDRQQLLATKPIFSIALKGKRTGGNSVALDANGEAVTAINYNSVASASAQPMPAFGTDAFQQKLTLKHYDAGCAAVAARATAGELVAAPGAPDGTNTTGNLYDLHTLSHETTHLRQVHMDSMYAARRENGRDFEMMRYLVANKIDDVPVIDHAPTLNGTKIKPYARPLNKIPRLQDRLAFTMETRKDLRPALIASQDVWEAHQRLKAELQCGPVAATHVDFDPSKPVLEEAYSETQRALQETFKAFMAAVYDLRIANAAPQPLHSVFNRAKVAGLGRFLPRNAAAVTDLASTVSIADITPQNYQPKDANSPANANLREDFDTLIDTNTKLSASEKAQLKGEMQDLVDRGFQMLRSSYKAFEAQTEVSVQFSKQAAVRFPGLLGKLTAYSNEFFVKAVESAQSAFHELIDASSGNFEPQAAGAPQAARDKIVEMQAKWAAAIPEIKYDTKAARDLIPDIDWFEIGAPLGVFNNFVTEYDAESSAIAANSPKELVEMYERNIPGLTDAQRQEVLNQATYVLSRGIEEVIPAGEAVIDYTAPAAGT